ncbi:oxidoreductase [Flexivirga endophytica]|uniref:Oxidoreductase n=1 Tax=Flexivirga endophytica TaxID=1849103 RepID=A0A916WPT0_9MICO|nr:SDR family oxidoreductase [Flexivirga endophytica]GGB22940.1 oxidoreductase [Flexivirga endophytica]GHB56874.1 oxidoreductase [Flexivirga endophytica]
MRLHGTIALVTGSSSGLGAAVARELTDHGVRVVVHGRDAERTRAVADDLGAAYVLGDLADPEQHQGLVDEATTAHGRLDLVVHNAGIGWQGGFDRMPPERIPELVATNLTAPISLSRAVLPQLLARERGHLCFVTSIAGRTGVAGEAVYAATKAALDAFADSLRLEAAGTGVEVSTFIPGVVDTDFFLHRGTPYARQRPRPRDVETVARQLVSLIASGRPERFADPALRVAPVVRSVWPAAYTRLAGRWGEKERLGGGD